MEPARAMSFLVTALLLAGCGSGGDSGGSDGGGGGDGGSAGGGGTRAVVNSARMAELNALRVSCAGTGLVDVSSHNALITAAIRHAGWQAIDDVTQPGNNLNHGEPRGNALFTADGLGDRIRNANGGTNLSGATGYYEDISSQHGAAAIAGLWNTVYHRVPMMRHRATGFGYGDMALARAEYPAVGVPASDPWGNPGDNGYATLNWATYGVPAITRSAWPAHGATGIPTTFASDTESPDPAPGVNLVGPPLHVIFPTTDDFTNVAITCRTAANAVVTCRVLVGGTDPAVTGSDASAANTVADGFLDRGEIFVLPLAPLAPGATYTWSVTATAASETLTQAAQSFTTAP